MGHIRAYSNKDNFITEKSITANNGLNPVLETGAKFDELKGVKEWSRILINFPLENIKNKIENGDAPDPRLDNSVSAFINMKNVIHGEPVPSDFSIWALPLTASWIEGKGLDSDDYLYEDASNAIWATSTDKWEDYAGGASGGNNIIGAHNNQWDSNSASQYFEHGEENLKVDITSFLKEFLDGASSNHGFMVRMSDGQEAKTDADAIAAGVNTSTTSSSWAPKKFYGRETNTTNAPFASLEWDSSIKDDRHQIPFSKNASLFYYNFENNQLVDLDGTNKFPGFVTLSADGVLIEPAGLTASRESKGIYRLDIGTAQTDNELSLTGINIGLSASSIFSDNWTISSDQEALVTSKTFEFQTKLPSDDSSQYYEISRYPIRLPNLKNTYEKGTATRIKLFIKDISTKLQSVTGMSNSLNSFTCTDGTFEIREQITDLVEVTAQNISYDKNGNYFYLDTNNLYRDTPYKIVFKLNIRGEVFYYDSPQEWLFTVK